MNVACHIWRQEDEDSIPLVNTYDEVMQMIEYSTDDWIKLRKVTDDEMCVRVAVRPQHIVRVEENAPEDEDA